MRKSLTVQTMRLLRVLLDSPEEWHYGLGMAEEADLKSGTLYPILRRLTDAGWLERKWEDVDPSEAGRPRRRLYRLTGDGAVAARREIAEHVASLAGPAPDDRRRAGELQPRGEPA